MYLLGIDPGAKGALCLLDASTGSHQFYDTPNTKALYDSLAGLEGWLIQTNIADYTAIEDIHSLGGMSAKSNFQFGRNLGLLEGLVHLQHPNVEYVQPKTWQKVCGVSFVYPEGASAAFKSRLRKQFTAARCHELYPDAWIYGPRGGLLDGRSDALMIAHYLRETKCL